MPLLSDDSLRILIESINLPLTFICQICFTP